MPHITFEHSANVTIDFQSFFKELTEQLVATGNVPKLGVKCRAVSSVDYYIIDGNPEYKMVNLLFKLREGRSFEIRQEISTIGMKLMERYFEKEIETKKIILSTEVKELVKELDLTKNAVR
ncbi:5-carboxymethyl-2-hydroxymuconate Delta-isomerase [Zobellia sp.]|nr:5-carboxymethyl-2-hydroxymuconate Delta-isomerase [Zobellia sp.]